MRTLARVSGKHLAQPVLLVVHSLRDAKIRSHARVRVRVCVCRTIRVALRRVRAEKFAAARRGSGELPPSLLLGAGRSAVSPGARANANNKFRNLNATRVFAGARVASGGRRGSPLAE